MSRPGIFCSVVAALIAGHGYPAVAEQSARHDFVTEPIFNGSVYIEQWGEPENPPVVLVHGLGNNGARDWRFVAPELAENFHVLTFDLPGFGRSNKGNQLYSPENYTRFVRWATDTYIDRPFVLIGHSMGGAIALNYAAKNPDRLERLILIDAAGILHRAAFSTHLFDELKPTWWWDILPKTNSEKIRALFGIDIADLDKYPFPVDMLLHTAAARRVFLGGDPARIAGLSLVQHDFSGLIERVTVPTLILWGERDAVAPLRTGKLLAAQIPRSRLEVIDGAHHVPMTETPRKLVQIVLDELTNDPRQVMPTDDTPPAHESAPAKLAEKGQEVECLGENDRHFTGSYSTLTIVQCKRVLIEDADIDFLEIRASSVEMFNSRIGREEKALQIENSILVATASAFSADVPIVIADSRLDFAGIKITAKTMPVEATGSSTALFSVSELHTPDGRRRLHGVFSLSPSQTLP